MPGVVGGNSGGNGRMEKKCWKWRKKYKRTKYNFKALCISPMLTGSRHTPDLSSTLREHTQLVSKWTTGYAWELHSISFSALLALALFFLFLLLLWYLCALRRIWRLSLRCVLFRFVFLFGFLSYFILFKLLIKGFRQQQPSRSRTRSLANSRLYQPEHLLFMQIFCRVLCWCFSVSVLPLNALKSCSWKKKT